MFYTQYAGGGLRENCEKGGLVGRLTSAIEGTNPHRDLNFVGHFRWLMLNPFLSGHDSVTPLNKFV